MLPLLAHCANRKQGRLQEREFVCGAETLQGLKLNECSNPNPSLHKAKLPYWSKGGVWEKAIILRLIATLQQASLATTLRPNKE